MSNHSQRRVLIIVPAYNEAANLPQVISDLRQYGPQWDIVVIDDGAQDGTGDVAEGLGVLVLRLPFNLGIGGAVQTGLIYGERSGYDICVQVDGDGQHSAEETMKLITFLEEAGVDAVLGSRFLCNNGFLSTFSRRLGIGILRQVIKWLTGVYISDPTSGHRAFGPRAISLLANDYPQEYPEPEVVYTLLRNALRVKEIPVVMKPRGQGTSSIGGIDSLLYVIKVLLAIFMRTTRSSLMGKEMSK